MPSVMTPRPRKPKAWTDADRNQFAVQLEREIPLRIHAPNGSHMFTLMFTGTELMITDHYVDGVLAEGTIVWEKIKA